MYLTKEKKQEIFEKYGANKTNTGSTEGQIALFTFRINHHLLTLLASWTQGRTQLHSPKPPQQFPQTLEALMIP